MERMDFEDCMASCIQCAEACDVCAVVCLEADDIAEMEQCIALSADCAQLCRTVAAFLFRHSSLSSILCHACAQVCEACANECATYAMRHCQDCARACRECADECRQMELILEGQFTPAMFSQPPARQCALLSR